MAEEEILERLVFGMRGASDPETVQVVFCGHDPGDVECLREQSFEALLRLDSFPFAAVEVEEFPIDRERNTFYPVAETLRAEGPRSVFSASEVAALRKASSLVPKGPPRRAVAETGPSGGYSLALPVQLPANGVLCLAMKGVP